MRRVFADTSFYQALLNPRDHGHDIALGYSQEFRGDLFTSEYVLFELGSLMSRTAHRPLFLELVASLEAAPRVHVIPASQALYKAGLQLFASRLDKDWSLTDCVSFVVMQHHGITEALAFDRHFEQAGFEILLTVR